MIFGPGEFARVGELSIKYGSKPLVVTGKWHAKNSGVLDLCIEYLTDSELDPVVFEGIEPNPRVGTVRKAAIFAAENGCDMVIGLGGGSVMDASKAIAFAFYDPDNIWKYVTHWEDDFRHAEKALPIVLVSTLAATGSEGNSGGVLTNEETNEKAGFFSPLVYPKVSIIDPELTLSLPLDYTRDGAVDMCTHVLEGYFNGDPTATFPDRISESLMVEVIIALEKVLENPEDIEGRFQLSYLGAIALTGFINRPRGGHYPLHNLEHPLSGHFDVSHGRGLAMILPRWLAYVSRENPAKIIQLGERVFALDLETHHPYEAADIVIERLSEWLEEIGEYFYLDDLGIPNDPAVFGELADEVLRMYGGKKGKIGGIKALGRNDIIEIYKSCIRTGARQVSQPKPRVETAQDYYDDDEDETGISVESSVKEVEIVKEVIVLEDGEPLPEGVEGEDYVVVEEVVEEEEER